MDSYDQSLVFAAKNGNEKAFEALYERYYQKIYALARTTLKNEADAEDVLQQTFVSVWQNLPKLENTEAFSTWIQRITLNHCRSLLRRRKGDASLDAPIDDASDGLAPEPESDLLLPQVYAEREDLRVRLGHILDELSDVQRQTILLYYYNELSVDEIAQIMDCSTGTVKSRLFLARKSIRTEIEEQERKSGQKFYGVVGLPLVALRDLFNRSVAETALTPAKGSAVLRRVLYASDAAGKTAGSAAGSAAAKSAAAGKAAAGAAAKKGGAALSTKIIAGIAALGLVGSGAFGAARYFSSRDDADEDREPRAAVTDIATEAHEAIDAAALYPRLIDRLDQSGVVDFPGQPLGHSQVSFHDMTEDGSPELIYIVGAPDAAGISATLHIDGWSDGAVAPLYEEALGQDGLPFRLSVFSAARGAVDLCVEDVNGRRRFERISLRHGEPETEAINASDVDPSGGALLGYDDLEREADALFPAENRALSFSGARQYLTWLLEQGADPDARQEIDPSQLPLPLDPFLVNFYSRSEAEFHYTTACSADGTGILGRMLNNPSCVNFTLYPVDSYEAHWSERDPRGWSENAAGSYARFPAASIGWITSRVFNLPAEEMAQLYQRGEDARQYYYQAGVGSTAAAYYVPIGGVGSDMLEFEITYAAFDGARYYITYDAYSTWEQPREYLSTHHIVLALCTAEDGTSYWSVLHHSADDPGESWYRNAPAPAAQDIYALPVPRS